MSDDTQTQSELEVLKERADTMGLKYHPNIGVDALRERVNAAVAGTPAPQDDEDSGDEGTTPAVKRTLDESVHSDKNAPEAESAGAFAARKQLEAAELVRVHVTNMNPATKDYDGDMFCAGNTVVGTHKKYVPFNQDYHVPRIILKMMKERKCQVFYEVKDDKGRKVKRGKLIKEFAIDILDPLTEAELKALAQRQAMANGTSE